MAFVPPFCPREDCPAHSALPFRWRRKGYYQRICDGRVVPRFLCLECGRKFSSQTFRLDYRLKRPSLTVHVARCFVSKVTHRQTARLLACNRKTVEHRLRLVGPHCRSYHRLQLVKVAASGGLTGVFQLDELETFEHNRRLSPVTMPVLIEQSSYFVVHTETAPLPARGGLKEHDRKKKAARDELHGKRRSGSTQAVRNCFEMLRLVHVEGTPVTIQTDKKTSYCSTLKKVFSGRHVHRRQNSKAPRNYRNPLFPINHTLAMLRDGISRLVRRNWGASKLLSRLALHAWVWIAYRNYIRGVTNKAPDVTPAMSIGIDREQRQWPGLLRWRVFENAINYGGLAQ